MDPVGDFHDFDIILRIGEIDLPQLNALNPAYENFDFKSDQSDISGWQAFVSVLCNAFVEAYDEAFGRE